MAKVNGDIQRCVNYGLDITTQALEKFHGNLRLGMHKHEDVEKIRAEIEIIYSYVNNHIRSQVEALRED